MNIISNLNVSANLNSQPPSNEFSKLSLSEKIERATQELGAAFPTSENTLEALTALTNQEDALIKKMEELVQRQMKLLEDVMKDEKEKMKLESDLKAVSAEKNNATKSVGKMTDALKKIKEHLGCAICTELSPVPTVVGLCGHITCSDCLQAQDESSFSLLTDELAAPANALVCLEKRRCSLCRGGILGVGLPVLALKEIAERILSFENKEKAVEKKRTYKISEERTQMGLLAMRSEAESIAAQCAIVNILPKISEEQWDATVQIFFSSSPVFFQTLCLTLASFGITGSHNKQDCIYAKRTQQKWEYPLGGLDWKSAVNKVEELEIFLNEIPKHQEEMTERKVEAEMKDNLRVLAEDFRAAVQKARNIIGGTISSKTLEELNESIRQALKAKSAYGKMISQTYCTAVTVTEAFSRIDVFKYLWKRS